MATLSEEDLRRSTLSRQFPPIPGCDGAAVLALADRLGPIQSQVPRSPFLGIAARLPGVSYETLCDLFEEHQLLRTSNLRGTVHTCTRSPFGALDAVARPPRLRQIRSGLKLDRVTAEEVDDQVRDYCADQWRRRPDLVGHVRNWLAAQEGPGRAAVSGTFSESLVWGNSGLLRRPEGRAWASRTDGWHRTAAAVLPALAPAAPEPALVALVRAHLRACGPLTRQDLAFVFGVGLRQVDRAVLTLGEEVVQHQGPGAAPYLDLAEPPADGAADPGLRLLPEFDGLLLGYAGSGRTRFLDEDELGQVWAKVNGFFSPVVLHEGRLVATWRLVGDRRRRVLEATMLGHRRPLKADLFDRAVADVARATGAPVDDVRVGARP